MIRNFRNRDTEALFNSGLPRRFANIERPARRKLLMLDAATKLDELRSPPGNRLEALRGDRKGQHSIRNQRPVAHLLPVAGRRCG